MAGDTRWREIEPLGEVNGGLPALLDTVDTLRIAWRQALDGVSPHEFEEARHRNLRRHAIETGIIERLYEMDWGVTESLIAEGLTLEAAERAGGIDEGVLRVVRSQFDALEFLVSEVRGGRELSVFFIRELHQLITRHQATYEGHNDYGQVVQIPLPHGEWKAHPNHVRRHDGTLLEYAPPEQVQPQMERLVELYAATADAHPIVRAAWLHHRFIRIHPFADGNGRVGRALTLLVLLRDEYAPLVVDRRNRESYLDAMDAANDGDLRPLVRLFAQLETVAIRAELERPAQPAVPSSAVASVARAHVQRFKTLREADAAEKAQATEKLATRVHERLLRRLDELGAELEEAFRDIDPKARAVVRHAGPPDEQATYWKRQLVHAAREVGFYANLTGGSWWARLHLPVLGETLRYLTAVQKVGHGETGFLAVTAYAEIVHPTTDEAEPAFPEPLLELSPTDAVTLAHTSDVDQRWAEVEELLQRTLSAAVDRFAQRIG